MAPNPYVKTVTGTNPPKQKKDKSAAAKVEFATPASGGGETKGMSVEEKEALKKEVLALGGDEEELKMLWEVESDSEVEGEEEVVVSGKKGKGGKVDAALSKDLKSLFKSLDFKGVGAAAVEESEEEEEAGEDEESEEEDEEEEESEEEVIAPKPAPAPKVVKAPEEKKESKFEREERRKAERDVEKEKERVEKAAIREEKAIVKPIVLKSPWIIDPTPQWYSVPLPAFALSATRPIAPLVATLLDQGTTLLAKENTIYATSLAPRAPSSAPPPPNGLSKADQVFIQQILTTGTSSDKISALLLLVSSSPLHTMSYLEQLASLCKKKSREESGKAVRGVVDWWRGGGGDGGGSPSRKLKAFADQPGLEAVGKAWESLEKKGSKARREEAAQEGGMSREEVEKCLVVWAFEDWLKKWFFQVLQALEQMSVDPLPHPRTQAVVHLSNLLRDKPEQESNILRLLVNKLGDSQRGIASKTSHHLLQVLQFHPGMTPIMVREVSALILRPSLAPAPTSHVRFGKDAAKDKKEAAKDNGQDHARYYGVITLNQVMLTRSQAEVAGKMIEVYFEIFGDILGRVADEEETAEGEEKEEVKKGGEKRKWGAKGKDGKKGEDKGDGEVNETDSKLVAAVLTGVNRAFPFAKIDDEAFKKRLDTLFRITHTGTFNVSIQALMLIYHVSAAKRTVSDRFYRALYSSLFDPRLAGSSKQALYLNLVFKAMKQDQDPKRVMALVKRLVQVMLGMEVTFILGSIWIVGELMATVPGLRKMLTEGEDVRVKATAAAEKDDSKPSSSHHDDGRYDGKKREPQFANAQNSCLWELVPLLNHFHPSVALHAEHLLDGEPISASTDLEQHSLNHFLDRFVYREVKKNVPTKGSSMMQSGVSGQDRSGRIVMKKGPARGDDAVVNSDVFRNKNAGDVPVDQLFFHKFFAAKTAKTDDKAKASKKRKSRKGKDDDSSDEESIGDLGFSDQEDGDEIEMPPMEDDDEDDEAEEEIWKAMKASMPKKATDLDDIEDDDSDDDDDDLAQFDYSDSDAEEGAEDVPFKSAFDDDESGDDDDGENLMEDDGDLIGSDEDMPLFGGEEGSDAEVGSKKQEQKKKKRKLKHLPMFATAEDYAHLLGGDDDGDEDMQ